MFQRLKGSCSLRLRLEEKNWLLGHACRMEEVQTGRMRRMQVVHLRGGDWIRDSSECEIALRKCNALRRHLGVSEERAFKVFGRDSLLGSSLSQR